jgi:hypothetical protein
MLSMPVNAKDPNASLPLVKHFRMEKYATIIFMQPANKSEATCALFIPNFDFMFLKVIVDLCFRSIATLTGYS